MAERNIGLAEARQNVSDAYMGKHGIYSVRGDDRVKVYSTTELSAKLESAIAQAGSPFRVDCIVVSLTGSERTKQLEVAKAEPEPEPEIFRPADELLPLPKTPRKKSTKAVNPVDKVIAATADASVNARGMFGYTKLHSAAIAGDELECDRLIAIGAIKTIKDNGGKMPWQKAQTAGHDALAEKLRP